jgi:hypothetical protein
MLFNLSKMTLTMSDRQAAMKKSVKNCMTVRQVNIHVWGKDDLIGLPF